MIKTPYGYFTRDGLEFVITNPETPRPWINYLTNDEYCAIISQAAGGYSFYRDCRTNRLLRWRAENWHTDRPGRYLYVRDVATKRFWSATYQPVRRRPTRFQARHGLGYTIIRTVYDQVAAELTYFVPRHDPCEVWLISLENRSRRPKVLEVAPYVEWLFGDYHQELRYRNIMVLYNRVWFDRELAAILGKKTAAWGDLHIQPFRDLAFFASSLPVEGCATRKDAFLGRLNTEVGPVWGQTGEWPASESASGEDAIATVRHRVSLAPGAHVEWVVVVGEVEGDRGTVKRLLAKYLAVEAAKQELAAVRGLWRARIVDNVQVETPDEAFNLMMNTWAKYQVYICNLWSRSPSFYHEGSGGRGYRDSCQDAEGILSINPEHARRKIETLATLIRRDGSTAPGWSETRGPALHRPNKDHPIWLTATVSAYVKETGDLRILSRRFPYLKDEWATGAWVRDPRWHGGAVRDGSGTLFEHLERNLRFTLRDTGIKGFPRIGHADWNDAIDAAGLRHRGSSVWLAMALVRSLKLLAELADAMGTRAKAAGLRQAAGRVSRRINRDGWDGAWYAAGFSDDGTVFGSSKNREGKIFLNTQSWAILADLVPAERIPQVLESVDRHLDGPHGLALFAPAYTTFDPKLGRITMFSEGTKENAAVFCHAATFMIAADLRVGRGQKAYERLKAIMPSAQADYELYKTEPYVYAEYLVGPQHPYLSGEGAFTWITGASSWNFMVGTEWVLGARRELEGLRVDPCLPRHWTRVRVRRPFRGATYDIEIHNPHGVEHGVAAVTVDGVPQAGTLIRPHRDGRVHRVRVVMGTARGAGRREARPEVVAATAASGRAGNGAVRAGRRRW